MKEIVSKPDSQSRHTGTWMNMQSDKGSDRYSDGDRREDRLIGVPTRQANRKVKSNEPVSRRTWSRLAGPSTDGRMGS